MSAASPLKRSRGRPSNASKAAEQARIASAGRPAALFQARYDAAQMGRRMRGWVPPMSGPNTATVGLDRIKSRARDVTRNDWAGESALQHWTTNLIGVGITAREKPGVLKSRRTDRSAMWGRWCKVCDADGLLDFYGQQTLGVRGWLESGEYFLRRRPRRADSGMEVPLQIQLIESDFCPLWDADTDPRMPVGNRIRSGIELDRSGQKVAYWIYKEHPGDVGGVSGTAAYYAPDPANLLRIVASDIKQVFEPKRIGQLRGVPGLASVLTRLRNIADFDDAVLDRQKLANLFVAFIKRTLPAGDDTGIDPATLKPYDFDALGQAMQAMEPGAVQELMQGEEMQFSNPPEPGTTFSEYMRTQQLGTSAGAGLPYELFSGDILNVSDRTLRITVNEFRRFAEQRQWQVVIPMHCQTIRDWWVESSALAGRIALPFVDEAKDCNWSPHGWQYIHPVQDAQGKVLEVANGARSRSSWIAERGDDPEEVDEERKADKDREDALGLTPPPPKPAAADPAKQARADAEIGLINAQIQAAERPVVPPVFNFSVAAPNVHNHLEPTPIQNHVTFEPPVNNITNNVEPPVNNITNNVEPPVNNITNNVEPPVNNTTINVNPTPFVIEAKAGEMTVDVNLPDREIRSKIDRDGNGNIIDVTQTEKTLLQ